NEEDEPVDPTSADVSVLSSSPTLLMPSSSPDVPMLPNFPDFLMPPTRVQRGSPSRGRAERQPRARSPPTIVRPPVAFPFALL
ncbi:hypothetical protein IWW55_005845, partial [Coemansia sp. RSA 2706]